MYYSAIGLLAILILFIENHDILLNRNVALEIAAGSVYRKFLVAVLAYYTTDTLWGVLDACKLDRLLFADTTVYYVAMAAGVLFWAQYTVAYLEEKTVFASSLVAMGRIIAGLITVFAFVNIFHPVLFTVGSDSVYHALLLRYVMLISQVLLLLLISIYAGVSIRFKVEKKNRYRTLTCFGLIMALLLFIQLWYPFLPLYTIAYLLGTSLLHTFVVNDEKEEYRRGLEDAAEIKELKDTISALLDNMPGMAFTKDAKTGVYLICNQAYAEYAQKNTPEEVTGLTDADLFDAEIAAHFAQDDQMALSMDTPFAFFDELLDGAGNLRQLQTTKLKFTDAAGRLCVLGISQDVSDTMRIQRENATTKEAYEKARITGMLYSQIAQSLARSYSELYYINVDTEEFIEYRTDDSSDTLTEARRGRHFFEQCRIEAERYVYAEDRDAVISALERRNMLEALDRSKTFIMTYRLISEKGPTYVTMKVTRMEDDRRFLIMGVSDVDEQMKERRAAERFMEEQTAYNRLSALTGDFICVYVVVPETSRYREFSATAEYSQFAQAKEGADFFSDTREVARRFCYPEDLNRFLSAVTRENIMAEIEQRGIFTIAYRLLMDGKPTYVQLKAAMVQEKEGPRLIVGLTNIDAQVRQDEEYQRRLAQARKAANVDALTGVKNRYAYRNAEKQLNQRIQAQEYPEFALVVLDVNDLKIVNDSEGHKAGDQLLRDACRIICSTFRNSTVFRVGGDEFAVIAQGEDYQRTDELVTAIFDHNMEAIHSGGVVVACGMAKYEGDACVANVFERADDRMYENKGMLKEKKREQQLISMESCPTVIWGNG